jgi:hypothetical protein
MVISLQSVGPFIEVFERSGACKVKDMQGLKPFLSVNN